MSNDEIKKNQFKKEIWKNDWSQIRQIFETCYPDQETKITPWNKNKEKLPIIQIPRDEIEKKNQSRK